MSVREKDGASRLTHLQRLAEQNVLDPILDEDLVPAMCADLYRTFLHLAGTKQASFGVSAITHESILAWSTLHNIRLTSWEVETIISMDAAASAVMQGRQRRRTSE